MSISVFGHETWVLIFIILNRLLSTRTINRIDSWGMNCIPCIPIWTSLVTLGRQILSQSDLSKLFGIETGRRILRGDIWNCITATVDCLTSNRLMRRSSINSWHFLSTISLCHICIRSTSLGRSNFSFETHATISHLRLLRNYTSFLSLLFH